MRRMLSHPILLLIAMAVLAAGAARAQNPPKTPLGQVSVIDVVAVDREGRFVEDLRPADFAVNVDGATRPVLWVRRVSRGPAAMSDAATRRAAAAGAWYHAFGMPPHATAADTVSLIVKLADGLSPSEQAAVIARNGGFETSAVPSLRLHVVTIPIADQPLVQQNYQADAQVVSIEVNKTRKAEATSTDTS